MIVWTWLRLGSHGVHKTTKKYPRICSTSICINCTIDSFTVKNPNELDYEV